MRTAWNFKTLLVLPLAAVLATALADDKTLSKEELAGKLNGVEPTDISDSPVKGLYQIALGGNVAYITQDGHYLFRGDIYDADTSANITEETRSHARVAMLASVDQKSMIVFKPKDGKVKHVVRSSPTSTAAIAASSIARSTRSPRSGSRFTISSSRARVRIPSRGRRRSASGARPIATRLSRRPSSAATCRKRTAATRRSRWSGRSAARSASAARRRCSPRAAS